MLKRNGAFKYEAYVAGDSRKESLPLPKEIVHVVSGCRICLQRQRPL